MVLDRKVFATAKVLLKEYGDNASDLVSERARRYRDNGDGEGALICRRILWAVHELTRSRPRHGEQVH